MAVSVSTSLMGFIQIAILRSHITINRIFNYCLRKRIQFLVAFTVEAKLASNGTIARFFGSVKNGSVICSGYFDRFRNTVTRMSGMYCRLRNSYLSVSLKIGGQQSPKTFSQRRPSIQLCGDGPVLIHEKTVQHSVTYGESRWYRVHAEPLTLAKTPPPTTKTGLLRELQRPVSTTRIRSTLEAAL